MFFRELIKAIFVFKAVSNNGMSNSIPFCFIRSLILITSNVGISRSFICVKSNKFRFKFSTSVTTTATSGKSSSFLFKSNSITTFSSMEFAFKLYVPGKSIIFALVIWFNLVTPVFLSTVIPG